MNIIKNWRPKYKQLILGVITFLSIIFIQNILTFSGEQQQCSPAPNFSTFKTSTGENYQWTNLRMGGGGFVTGIVIHPTHSNLIYARTDVGGLYRWQPEKQTWLQLIQSDTVPKKVPLNIESVAIDPQNPNIIYTAIGAYTQSEQKPKPGMLLKSENQGQSWKILNLALPMGGNEFWRWTGERLAVDPNNSNIVYFGSRLNGLWLSQNGGESWNQINPKQVPLGESHPETNQKAGVSFVTFDPTSETLGGKTQTIYVGVSGKGIYCSQNSGQTWELLKHNFDVKLVPQQGVVNSQGELIVTFYHSQKQPQGKVLKYTNNTWEDITPEAEINYAPVAVDPQKPDTIFVSSYPMTPDTIYRSTDGGKQWTTLKNKLNKISWWPDWSFYNLIGAIAISPQNSDQVWLTNGIGIWKTEDGSKDQITWSGMVNGLEETVAFDAVSLPGDHAVITAIADFDGFRHESFCEIPKTSHSQGVFNTTTQLAYSFNHPNFVVSVGANHHEPDKIRAGFSQDYGKTWQQFDSIKNKTHPAELVFGNVAVSATNPDHIVWQPTNDQPPYYTKDRGKTWNKIDFFAQETIGGGAHTHLWNRQQILAADSVQADTFYLYHHRQGYFLRSQNGGETWEIVNQNLPGGIWNGANLKTAPGIAGEVWVSLNEKGLYRSSDFGQNFSSLATVEEARVLTFGKAAPGANYPTVFIHGRINGEGGIFRSIDLGQNWVRIAEYPMGSFADPMVIVGDMNTFGRVFVGTSGNGFIYGQQSP
ncbi:WD40/YVTN/BNR-like repeat-containing protein [Planktothrix paucivesiculata]|uniref:Probably secreted sialidase several ASP-boxes and dockerin domain n=1 Tax=Planktothrix paucivesiculata PCC 9631 TaxID=671071 RepID=A0A7Z9C231_9CYAN|nr:hypothetical protein [Planktothrix paucivesiculata]VXD24167.1 Probably secreted sialidase; several ASP-boxes and dockerin domain [Planktothrix paucivesiculata PCC 9631]